MHRSELNGVKDEFRQQIKRSFELIKSMNKARSSFLRGQVYTIYELSFLRIFLAWEWFIENTFVSYMLGKKTDKGYSPKLYVKPLDRNHAYNFVKEGRDYADWLSPDVVIRKARLFFRDGEPYRDALMSIIGDIQDMKTLRNSIVHMSAGPREKFETLVRNKLGYVKTPTTPGEFLATPVKGKSLLYVTYFSNQLELASGRIIR